MFTETPSSVEAMHVRRGNLRLYQVYGLCSERVPQPTLPRDPTSCDVAAIDTGTPFPSEGCPFQIPKEDDSHRTHRSKECTINKNNGLKRTTSGVPEFRLRMRCGS